MFINRQLGEFILLRRLAVGGQSEIFLALKQGPQDFSRPVVIKALPTRHRNDPRYVELFYREAFLSVRFAHPHLVTVHDVRVLRDEHCMVMDFIPGQTVADIAGRGFQSGNPLSINDSVLIVADACDGLDYAHHFQDLDATNLSVVHRDVSPQNLMVTYVGVTKVFDFGIAMIREETAGGSTQGGGKFAYMSPEQCRDEPADARSDIFSLGIILYELTCARRLFRRDTAPEVIRAVTEEPIAAPSELDPDFDPALEAIIMRALARDPAQRYQRAGDMRDELLEYLAPRAGRGQRRQIGRYVAEMFAREREEIAQTIREAYALTFQPKPVGQIPLEKLGFIEGDAVAENPTPQAAGGSEAAAKAPADAAQNERHWSDFDEPGVDDVEDAAALRHDGGAALGEADGVDLAKIREAKRKNQNLVNEVIRLRRRQNVLMVLLVVVTLVAAAILAFSLKASPATPATPIELGSPPASAAMR